MNHSRFATVILVASMVAGTTHGDSRVMTLRILNYNIRNATGMDNRRDMTRTADFIKAQRPDIVALQEVDKGTKRSGNIDLAARLGELTGLHAAFGKAMDFQGGAYGDAVLSRFPFQKIIVHPLPAGRGHEPRELLETHVMTGTNNLLIVFYNTHLDDSSDDVRLAQAKVLTEIAGKQNAALQFLAGDFNAEPSSSAIREIVKFWRDAGPDPEFLTWPSDKPKQRIDYVFYRPNPRIRIVEAKVLDEPVISDHRPVLVTVEIAEN